ncbi:MAG: DUF1624 domain-containing protein [Clostridia bacterium]|nr:DUF1624 domain-containing protein [Clostridia bacterium]
MKSKNKSPQKRIQFLDALRGLCLVSMAAYHTMWDCVNIFGVNEPWFKGSAAHIWQQSIGWTFILLSGFCICLGKNSLKRGLTVFVCGALVSAVTLIFMPEDVIIFGVLTLIGTCMLLTAALSKLLNRIPPSAGIALNFILFLFLKNIHKGYAGFFGLIKISIPTFLYKNYFTAFFGMPPKGFHSADYYPLVPWMFLFLTGYFVFRLLERKGLIAKMKRTEPKRELFTFLGRNSLLIYMLHQPVIYGLLYLIFKILPN